MKLDCLLIAFLVGFTTAQDYGEEYEVDFDCPEPNGRFRDEEQCDLFYTCRNNVAMAEFCPEGLVFDDSTPNREHCAIPQKVDCGNRLYVQEPSEEKDPRCERANGVFNHPDETVCDKYIQCGSGNAFEQPCPTSLIFDVGAGQCTREKDATLDARICPEEKVLAAVDGFTCPGTEAETELGQAMAHPLYPHPTDCRAFFSCFNNKEPNKLGCTEEFVFDAETLTCKSPEDVPECRCWYGCREDSLCPLDCLADCTCP